MSLYYLASNTLGGRFTFTTKDAAYQFARNSLGEHMNKYQGPVQVEITGGILSAFEVTQYGTKKILTIQPFTVQVDGSIFIDKPIKTGRNRVVPDISK